jgi:hypothetical protein
MCHVALGIVEAYWEYRLKPWDMAAGVLVSSTYQQLLLRPNFEIQASVWVLCGKVNFSSGETSKNLFLYNGYRKNSSRRLANSKALG